MSSSVIQYAPATLLIPPAEKKRSAFSPPKRKAIQPPNREPETRLWKLARRSVSRIRATVELFILAVFFLAGLAVITDGFATLSHLLQTESVEQVAAKAINGDA